MLTTIRQFATPATPLHTGSTAGTLTTVVTETVTDMVGSPTNGGGRPGVEGTARVTAMAHATTSLRSATKSEKETVRSRRRTGRATANARLTKIENEGEPKIVNVKAIRAAAKQELLARESGSGTGEHRPLQLNQTLFY
jgi:cysteine sulfinate desulfinase/cysteine desulfurase-like protein